jgi:peptidoglycan hydrolase-like protein with peptidoglycan-binding domain
MPPGKVAPAAKNKLVVRVQRRIVFELGDLDAVFAAANTVQGQKQRLQSLGYYYEPLNAAAPNTATEAFTRCLEIWRKRREEKTGRTIKKAAEIANELSIHVREFILDKGKLPAVGGERRVRVPGALTFSATNDLGDGGVADGTALASIRYNDETALWAANPTLGQIPLVVTVEKKVKGKWQPAAGESVHFQLIAPFHDAAAHELDDVNALRNSSSRPAAPPAPAWAVVAAGAAVAAGPRQFLTTAMNHNFDPNDPQRYNAHQSRAGKRGLAVLNNIFAALPAAGFPGMNAPAASPAPRTHAVFVQTNAQGKGGVMFTPSRMGGDRYRIRAFLDPNGGLPSNGTEADAVVHETGRFVVWKHVLWWNYLPKPAPRFPALKSVRGIQARLAVLGYDTGAIDGNAGPLTQAAIQAFQGNYGLAVNGNWQDASMRNQLNTTVTQYMSGGGPVYVNGFGPQVAPFNFLHANQQFTWMYCELELNPAIRSASPQKLSAAQLQPAIRWAIGQAQASYPAVDLSAMFSDEFQTPFLFEVRHPLQYNRIKGAAYGAFAAGPGGNYNSYWQWAARAIYDDNALLQLVLRYITGGASSRKPPGANLTRLSSPGLTLVAAMAASRLFWPPREAGQVQITIGSFNGCQASGIATKERAASVYGGTNYYGTWVYIPNGYTKNALHEMGHTLYLRHQFTGPNYLHPSNFREDHDSRTAVNPGNVGQVYDRCLMGYLPGEGEFCGKCHLKLRGWDISQLPVV